MERPAPNTILTIYAVLIGLSALKLVFYPPAVPMSTLGAPYFGITAVRLIGMVMLVSATFGAALARLEDSASLRGATTWFLAGQWIAAPLVLGWYEAIFDFAIPSWPLAVFLAGTLLATFWRLGNRTAPADLRSRYEEQIRHAAGREERHRLARDLHDSIKQQIFAIHTAAATAQAAMPDQPSAVAQAIAQVRQSARDAMTEMETMLDHLQADAMTVAALVAAIGKLCESTRLRTGARVHFETGALPSDASLAPGATQTLLRVAQETLSNTARHARASYVEVRLDGAEREVTLSVRDDGQGFDPGTPSPSGMGLRNIRARAADAAGTATIESSAGQGTLVRISLPLLPPAPGRDRVVLGIGVVLGATMLSYLLAPNAGNALRGVLEIAVALAAILFLALHLRWRQ